LQRGMPRYLVVACLVTSVAGCATLPDSGPAHRSVEANASVSILGTAPVFDYALVDLNRNILPFIVDPGPGSLFRTFGTGRGPAPEIRVGIGDTVQVTLFEAQSGGLFIPTDAGARPGNFVALPGQTVDSKGYITVPYAGQILALNRSTPAIQQDIINKLKIARSNRRPSSPSRPNFVGGHRRWEVNKPDKVAINANGDTVLDAISRAGGIKDQGYENYVTLQRHGLKGTVYFLNLVKDPKENIFVKPGDAIYVSFYQRSFIAFGATGASGANGSLGSSAQFKFQQETLTLNDAVGKAGGLLDSPLRSRPGLRLPARESHRAGKDGRGHLAFPRRQAADPDDLSGQLPRSLRLLCIPEVSDA